MKTKEYWDLKFSDSRRDQGIDESAEELDELLGSTIRNHIISDVPVGILLSGGVDSTAVLSYAAEGGGTALSTFTIGFDEYGGMDERLSAREAASRFGTKHFEATFTAKDFAECLPKYVWHMEEPVCEPPAIALYFITKLARDMSPFCCRARAATKLLPATRTTATSSGWKGSSRRSGR